MGNDRGNYFFIIFFNLFLKPLRNNIEAFLAFTIKNITIFRRKYSRFGERKSFIDMTQHSILSKESAQEKLHRMALEIAENIGEGEGGLILIGIEKNGVAIAEKIKAFLIKYYRENVEVLSLSLNKDFPEDILLNKVMDLNDKNIVLIDDVSNSGKTLLYALKPLLEFHPKRIQTLVMIERMHKLFPIKPDYVGLSLATTLQDHIRVIIENGDLVGVTFE